MKKMDRDGEKKNKYFIGTVTVMPCQISSWIMGLWIYEEGRRENPDSTEFTCYDRSFGKDPG